MWRRNWCLSGRRILSYRPAFHHGASLEESRRAEEYQGHLQVGTWNNPNGAGQLAEAIQALDLLVQRGTFIHSSFIYDVIKKCMAQKDLVLGSKVHALAVESGHGSDSFLANHFICMYASHERLEEAIRVFNHVAAPNRYVWASIILAHARHGQPMQAMKLYREMRGSHLTPNNHVFVAALKACATAKSLGCGREVHGDVLAAFEEPDMFVYNCLVDMYAKCGSLEDARIVFENMPGRDVVTWTAMIAGYTQHGLGLEALTVYDFMQQEGNTEANHITFACLLQACADCGALHQGKQLHAQIQEKGLEADLVVANCLISVYAKCGSLEDARMVFNNLPRRDVVTWNTMLSGYAQHGLVQEALALYAIMEWEAITPPDAATFVSLLQACSIVEGLEKGKEIHAKILRCGVKATDLFLANALVDMYVKCGSLEDAHKVFDNLPTRDVVTWTTMIAGYAQHGLWKEALGLYTSMQRENSTPADAITFICLLQACSSIGDLNQGKLIHAQIQERGLEDDSGVGNSLVNMYVKCRSLEDARRVFSNLPNRDLVTWNAMISGYVQHGLSQEAISLFQGMQQDAIRAVDAVTFVCLLQACSSVAGLEKGKEIHDQISQIGLDKTDLFVVNSLIDMYAKCGSMANAQEVFDAVTSRDIVTWNALIAGYARQGKSALVFYLFQTMRQEDIQPNGITFLSILTVCNHVGLVDNAHKYFEVMSDYGVAPAVEHYNCMVDLFARAGQFENAMDMVNTMPFQPQVEVWRSLLGACRKWRNVEVGRQAFDCAVKLSRDDAGAYIVMSDIYQAAKMWQEATEIQEMRVRVGARKEAGQSWWTDLDGVMHTFIAGDRGKTDRRKYLRERGPEPNGYANHAAVAVT